MHPTFSRLAITVPRRHVPLIKFLGPRKKLNLQNNFATQNTVSKTNTSVSQKASEKATVSYNDLPARFKRTQITQEEIEAVEMGGAGFLY